MKILKIKQEKNNLDKLVSSSFLALFIVISLYIYQNVNIVFNMINYKKSITKISNLEKDLLVTSNNMSQYKKELSLTKEANQIGLKKVSNSDFVVRKNTDPAFSMLYDIR